MLSLNTPRDIEHQVKKNLIDGLNKVKNRQSPLEEIEIKNIHDNIGILYDNSGNIVEIDKDCILLAKIKLLLSPSGKMYLDKNGIMIPNDIEYLIDPSNFSRLSAERKEELKKFVSGVLLISSAEQIVESYYRHPKSVQKTHIEQKNLSGERGGGCLYQQIKKHRSVSLCG